MADELWDLDRVAIELSRGGNGPLAPASARKEMSRGGIRAQRGYPADEVKAYAAGRRGKGYRSDLRPMSDERVTKYLTGKGAPNRKSTGQPHREES